MQKQKFKKMGTRIMFFLFGGIMITIGSISFFILKAIESAAQLEHLASDVTHWTHPGVFTSIAAIIIGGSFIIMAIFVKSNNE